MGNWNLWTNKKGGRYDSNLPGTLNSQRIRNKINL